MANRLSGKRCVIVGGTSGLGLAAARRFLEEGARLFLTGRDDDHAPRALAALEPVGAVAFMPCEAGDEKSIEAVFRAAVQCLGGLDVLYHVAGMSGRKHGDGPLHACSLDGWHATLAGNLTSVFLSNRAAVRHFLNAGQGGVLLNMGSVLALAPAPEHFDTYAYTAAKGAIVAMSRQSAARYAAAGIRVNVLAPGLMDTPMSQRAVSDATIRAYLQAKQPLAHGPGAAEDVAEAAVFLCSDESRLITGAVLAVDGGWSVC
jgi:NAD(P)-dependent dehydrogenase (short-subunit alcohol dehydrogenase family)